MFGKIKGFPRDFFRGQRFNHIRYGLKYALVWIVLCLVITNVYGKQSFELQREFRTNYLTQYIEIQLAVLRETARTQDLTTDENQVLIRYTLQQLDAYVAQHAEGTVRTGSICWPRLSTTHTDEDDNVYLEIAGDNGRKQYLLTTEDGEPLLYYDGSDRDTLIKENVNTYYYCPRKYLKEVMEETIGTQKSEDSSWWATAERTGWRFKLEDGYLNGFEFRPVHVLATYYENGKAVEERSIDCHVPDEEAFKRVKTWPDNEILIPKDVDSWQTESYDDQLSACFTIYGDNTAIYPLYFNPRWTNYEYEVPIVVHSYLLAKKFVLFGRSISIPFSHCSGDYAYIYSENLTDVKGNEFDISLRFTAPGMLASHNKTVFRDLLIHYIVLGLLIGILALKRYRRMFSLRTASRFHKTLISSMAHDLKTPLMIMQGFGENLAENVHTEKREYYAEQILDNVRYLNGLIDKNLDLAKKEDDSFTRIGMYVMRLVEAAESRYQELLNQKNLTIRKEGDILVHGDKALLQTVVDNLIVNAIKYSPEGGEILVRVQKQRISVSNSANLSYDKNINKLLEPLEMGDESRTTGKGTGLGLSIANTIVEQHGWKMKLSYDKPDQIFTCTIKIPKRRQ